MKRRSIFYATRSLFKREELTIISSREQFVDATGEARLIGDAIEFKVSDIETEEPLEIDLQAMDRPQGAVGLPENSGALHRRGCRDCP